MIVISRLSVGVLTFVFQGQLEFQCALGCLEFFTSSSRVYCVVVAQKSLFRSFVSTFHDRRNH